MELGKEDEEDEEGDGRRRQSKDLSESGEGKEGDKVPKQASKSCPDFREFSFQFTPRKC